VALATAAAGNSGLFGSLSEGMATASTIAEGMRLKGVGQKVTAASTEGGSWASAANVVSDGEKQFLAQLESTIA
jgi:hypothetical protein